MFSRCLLSLALVSLFWESGCNWNQPAPPPPPSTAPLRVIVVDDPLLGSAIAKEWLAHTESELQLSEISAEQAAKAQHLPADVIIYAPALLGQLAASDLLLPLDESALAEAEFARDDLFPHLQQETSWGRRTVAVPLGSPQLALFYRADWLAERNLTPPKTWQEYGEVLQQFQERPAGVGEATAWQPAAEPLATGWGAKLLLGRVAASGLHRDQLSPLWKLEKLEPLITGPPWQRALEQLVADNQPPGGAQLTPVGCYEKLLAGECAFAIGWPGSTETGKSNLQPAQVGVVLLPGSAEVYQPLAGEWEPLGSGESVHVPLLGVSGRVASVTRASSQPRVATQFVLWLSGPAVSGRIAPVSATTTVFRGSHLRNGTWQAPEAELPIILKYGEVLQSERSDARRFVVPRIPGQDEYLAALDAAVLAAVRGDQSAAAALQEAAQKWQAITEARGLAQQQRALRSSLGLGD